MSMNRPCRAVPAGCPATSIRRPSNLLDWFHITMRITVLTQLAKGLRCAPETAPDVAAQELQRLKWFLWHGNVFRARQTVDDLTTDITDTVVESGKLAKAVREFGGYLAANAPAIPNYGERRRAGEDHLHLFVESAVNQVISKTHGQETADALEPPRRAPTTADPHPRPQPHPHRRLPTLVPRPHAHNRSRAPGRVASHGLSRSPTPAPTGSVPSTDPAPATSTATPHPAPSARGQRQPIPDDDHPRHVAPGSLQLCTTRWGGGCPRYVPLCQSSGGGPALPSPSRRQRV